jgi:purine-binding chemotaxis protein CheW
VSFQTITPANEEREIPTRPTFVFESNNIRYGFDARYVREVFFLPQVEALPEAPRDIIGAIDLRGQIVPVMDLELRFGFQARDYHITDSTIVFECDGILMALVVSSVFAVQDIPIEDFRAAPTYGRSDYDDVSPSGSQPAKPSSETLQRQHRFMTGIAQTKEGAVRLLDCSELVHYSQSLNLDSLDDEEGLRRALCDPEAAHLREFCPKATAEEREIFRQRAITLQARLEDDIQTDKLPLAIVEISGEFFGIDLKVVREFFEVKKIVPIPCCPDRILGNTNLRGEILTIVSLHELLGLPAYTREEISNAVVVVVDSTIFGIAIDAVFDVMHLQSEELSPIPTALQGHDDEFIRGTASYRKQMISVLDLEAIIQREVLVVNDR